MSLDETLNKESQTEHLKVLKARKPRQGKSRRLILPIIFKHLGKFLSYLGPQNNSEFLGCQEVSFLVNWLGYHEPCKRDIRTFSQEALLAL